jgi:hypothetical protein
MSDNPADIFKRVCEIQGISIKEAQLDRIRSFLENEVLPLRKVIYAEWVEPFHYVDPSDPDNYNKHVAIVKRITKEDAITLQKANVALDNKIKNRNFKYDSDEIAFEDFVITHWATIKEYEE